MRINKVDDGLDILRYVWAIWAEEGKDLNTCELCGVFTKNPEIHHTKYDGATIKDLVVSCRRCQMQPSNMGLS